MELVQNDKNNKSFKMLPELVPSGCMSMPWGSFPAQDQVSGERYRTVGLLVIIIIIVIINFIIKTI